MKILSIDIGIRNLAMCVIDSERKIHFWKDIDILQPSQYISEGGLCQGVYKSGKKKGTQCGSRALFTSKDPNKDESYYCKTHLPKTDKQKGGKKGVSSANASLQKLCVSLVTVLDRYPELLQVEHVAIEQQPSKNPKMKAMSHLVYSYFVMRGVMVEQSTINKVLYISPRNKLTVYDGPEIQFDANLKKYKDRKALSVLYAQQMIAEDPINLTILCNSCKADDLADCYLQAVWYLNGQAEKEAKVAAKAVAKATTKAVKTVKAAKTVKAVKAVKAVRKKIKVVKTVNLENEKK